MTEPATLPGVVTPSSTAPPTLPPPGILPLTWEHPKILPAGFTALLDRFWAEEGGPGTDVTVHVASNGRPSRSAPQIDREPPYADVWFVASHHLASIRGVGAVPGACWLFAQWKLLADALIQELQFVAVRGGAESLPARRRRLQDRAVARDAFYARVLAGDDRLGQPRTAIGGLVGALWGRRLTAWAAYRKHLRAQADYQPHEYPRAVLDDLRAVECGGQHTLGHLVQTLLDRRYPGVIPFGETEQQVQATYRFLRNEKYLLRYHLLNACPELGIWRTVLARTPGRDGARRVYHFFTHGERARLLAAVEPGLPAPKPPPWAAWARTDDPDHAPWNDPETPW